ncbi:MAG TPA: enoyl-CoA hydratase/isomerase family protein [Polyangiaceae bacterium]|nr:MAG: 2,3-dehydroadipyl-CoA hydratase [Deltaproteobacteria bacterium ADurb.Bin207]HNZ22678.1 enoyl-CoA hydratase/isomerase family protein [Polyangiaceae bacterium]HOD21572.1 enoyl-CoA hydratase/isomerase family protein [Polyangiaceae bacterium]HOE49278.1 enoyl-CoA hydratase/isomerase family protein [Polyangiaceae bacterium]HOH00347.1 enoyl-CoA hydratase/isomerase family protein [Polyangiaceae bacterium]
MIDDDLRIHKQGAALIATIDRPSTRNAIAKRTAEQIVSFLHQASNDESVRTAIMTGAGQEVFVAGGDLHEFDSYTQMQNGASHVLGMGIMTAAMEACDVPVIAAVQGAALGGGCEIILACDLVIAEQHARFSFRQAAMGLSTGWGGGTRLLERVGPMRTAQWLLSGATIDANEALQNGLVANVVPKGSALQHALTWTDKVAQLPRASVAGLKRMIHTVRQEMRGHALQREARVFSSLWAKPDHLAAMKAFLAR